MEADDVRFVSSAQPNLTISADSKPLLTIRRDGTVEAPDLESASEAGRAFVVGIRHALTDREQRMATAMNRFCDRVEAGEVRSRRTYAEFCEILGRAPRQ